VTKHTAFLLAVKTDPRSANIPVAPKVPNDQIDRWVGPLAQAEIAAKREAVARSVKARAKRKK
jgi:hypothetical protein